MSRDRSQFHRIGAFLLLLVFMHGVGWQIIGAHQSIDCDEHYSTAPTNTAEAVDHEHPHEEDCSICRLQRHFSNADIAGTDDEPSGVGTSYRSVNCLNTATYYRFAETAGGGSRGPPESLIS